MKTYVIENKLKEKLELDEENYHAFLREKEINHSKLMNTNPSFRTNNDLRNWTKGWKLVAIYDGWIPENCEYNYNDSGVSMLNSNFDEGIFEDSNNYIKNVGNEENKIKDVYKCLLLGDIHVNYHSKSTLNIVYNILKNNDFDLLCMAGDELDLFSFSKFSMKIKDKPSAISELESFIEIMDNIKKIKPELKTVRLGSNHIESRIESMIAKLPEVESLFIDFMKRLKILTDINLDYGEWFYPFSEIGNNKIRISHGRYLSTMVQANKSKVDSIIAHIHTPSMNTSPVSIAYSIPALCDLSPKYLQGIENSWKNGFGVLKYYPKVNQYRVDLYIEQNGMIVYDDTVYNNK